MMSLAAMRAALELAARKLDALHEKITKGWDYYSDERADGAHNALTNGAKAIRAIPDAELEAAMPKQDPVAWRWRNVNYKWVYGNRPPAAKTIPPAEPLYTTPAAPNEEVRDSMPEYTKEGLAIAYRSLTAQVRDLTDRLNEAHSKIDAAHTVFTRLRGEGE